MAISNVIKKGSTAPTPSDIIQGGIAVDTVNKVMYSKGADDQIFEVTQPDTSKLGIDGLVDDYRSVGLTIYPDITLTTEIGTGEAYIGSKAVVITAAIPHLYVASKDTYVDMDSSGEVTYTEVDNGAGEPALVGGWFRLAKVVTDVDNITSVDERNLPFTLVGRDVVADGIRLDTIEDNADVTDAVNVAAAGAVMEGDTSTVAMAFVDGDITLAASSTTKVPTQNAVKTFVNNAIASTVDYIGGYDASTNTPNLDDVGNITVDKGDMYTVTVGGTFYTAAVSVGDTLIAQVAGANEETEWTIVNSNLDAPSVKTLYESNANTNVFTDAEQSSLATMADNANAYVHPNHTGDVASTADGLTVIASSAVTLPKLADISQNSFIGRNSAGTGVPQNLTAIQARAILGVDTDIDLKVNLSSGRKNYIINGNFDVWQGGESFTGNGYTADMASVEGDILTERKALQHVEGLGSVTPLRMTYITAPLAGGSNVGTRLENIDFRKLRGKDFILSFYARASSSVDYYTYLFYAPGTNWDASTRSLTTDWVRYTVLGHADDSVSNEDPLIQYLRLANQFPEAGDWVEIVGVQLEEGDEITPFEHRSYAEELALCQRYYYTNKAYIDAQYKGDCSAGIAYHHDIFFPVEMRVLPTITVTGGSRDGFNEPVSNGNSALASRISALCNTSGAGKTFNYTITADSRL